MLYGLYVSTAGALVETTRQEAIANNLANTETPAFKRDFTIFRARKTEAEEESASPHELNRILERIGGGLVLDETPYQTRAGNIESTEAVYDLAIEGEGFFAVGEGDRVFYTRSGNFTTNRAGELVTADGRYKVLDEGGSPILIRPETGESPVISPDGTVRVDGEVAARIRVQGVDDPRDMRKHGWTVYEYVGEGKPRPAAGKIRQGFLEQSNVEPVREMVGMIAGYRAYEANTRLIREQDRSLQRLITDLPRIA